MNDEATCNSSLQVHTDDPKPDLDNGNIFLETWQSLQIQEVLLKSNTHLD